MATVDVNGTTIYYEEHGSGAACLLMHGGLGVDHSYFRPAFDRLGSRLRLVFYDHRCNGRSGRPPVETISMEQLADDADALARALGGGRVYVIGHSYGGFVAQEFAIRHGHSVAGLVLVGTTPGQLGASETSEEAGGPPTPREFEELFGSEPADDAGFEELMRKAARFYVHRADPSTLESLIARSVLNRQAAGRGFAVLAGWSSVDRLHTIPCPTLLLVGSHDIPCSPSQSYRIARRIPGADVVEIAEAGHFPWLDDEESFFAPLETWLDRLGAGS